MERRERRPDPAVFKKTVTIGGRSTQMTIVDLSMVDPNAPAPEGDRLQCLVEEVRNARRDPLPFRKR